MQRFDVVEVQCTFYAPPADAVLTHWRSQVAAGFELTMQAWQFVTHESNSPTYRRMKQPLPRQCEALAAPRPPGRTG